MGGSPPQGALARKACLFEISIGEAVAFGGNQRVIETTRGTIDRGDTAAASGGVEPAQIRGSHVLHAD